MNHMLNFQVFVVIMIFLLSSCNKKQNDTDYCNLYDQLTIEYVSLDSLQSLTGIKKADLVAMRYGILEPNKKVTDRLTEIVKLSSNPSDKSASKLSKLKPLHYESEEKEFQLTKDKFDEIALYRLAKFEESRDLIVSNFADDRVDRFIDNKFTFWSVLPNTWNYFTKSEENFSNNFMADLNCSGLAVQCDSVYIIRVNSFTNTLKYEHNLLLNDKSDVPEFAIIPSDSNIEIDKLLEDAIIARTKSQIKELSFDILWDVIAALIIAWIINIIMSRAINSARDRAIDNFIYSTKDISLNDGWKNAIKKP